MSRVEAIDFRPGRIPDRSAGTLPLSRYYLRIADIARSYQPWEQVFYEVVSHPADPLGKLLRITDTYLPPCQEDGALKLDGRKISRSPLPSTADSRTPASMMFEADGTCLDHRGQATSATGPLTVEDFNLMGYGGSVWPDSPLKEMTMEWRRRAGLLSRDWNGCQPSFTVATDDNNKVYFRFADLDYNDGISQPYGGIFNKGDLAQIGYAAVLLAYHLPLIPTAKGDYFLVRLNLGTKGPKELFLVQDQGDKVFYLLTRVDAISAVAVDSLFSNDNLSDDIKRGSAMNLVARLVQWEKDGQPTIPTLADAQRANEIALKLAQVDIIIADPRESIDNEASSS